MVAIGELSGLLMVRMLLIRKPDQTSHYVGMRGGGGGVGVYARIGMCLAIMCQLFQTQ